MRHRRALADFPIPMSILELCAGAGTASLALKMLLGNHARLAGAWDTADDVRAIHETIHGKQAQVHLGAVDGDIMATPLSAFPSAHILVAGPPCPPFSACGKRLAMSDPRSRPFERCVEVIEELDSRGANGGRDQLMFFMLENVPGLEFRVQSSADNPLEVLLRSMRSKLGTSWLLRPTKLNAIAYGLPQNRPRIYIVGRKVKVYPRSFPALRPSCLAQVSPIKLLDITDTAPSELTALQLECNKEWKALYRAAMLHPANRGSVAFIEVGRSPTGRTSWASTTTAPPQDRCQCLRASGPQIHVFSLGEGDGQPPGPPLSIDRNLRISERAALQGFPPSIGHLKFTEKQGRRIFGNAMALPVIGSLLAEELTSLLDNLGRLLESCTTPAPQPRESRPPQPQPMRVSPGPQTIREHADSLEESREALGDSDILPGQCDAVIQWTARISNHWSTGQPGRAPKHEAPLLPCDHIALAKRQRLGMGACSASSASRVIHRASDESFHAPGASSSSNWAAIASSCSEGARPPSEPSLSGMEGEDIVVSDFAAQPSPTQSWTAARQASPPTPEIPPSVASRSSTPSIDEPMCW